MADSLGAKTPKRYTVRSDHIDMYEDPDGNWVSLADYEALRAEVDRARKESEAWEDYASHQEWCSVCGEDGVSGCDKGSLLKERANALAVARRLTTKVRARPTSGVTPK